MRDTVIGLVPTMHLPPGTNIIREWGAGKLTPICQCGWDGRRRNLTDENHTKAVQDIHRHLQTDAHKRKMAR